MDVSGIARVLVQRDGMSPEDAIEYAKKELGQMLDGLGSGELSEFDVEDMFQNAFGLEPDYLLEALI